MANVFLDLPTTAGNGPGTAIDVSSMGGLKTVTVARTAGVFQPAVTIEFSNEAGAPTVWTPLKTFAAAGQQTFVVAAMWMRATVSNYRGGGAPNCDVASDDVGTAITNLPALAVSGAAAPVNVAALENLKTIQVTGAFRGVVNIEISVDGTGYETITSFKNPGAYTAAFQAQFMRVVRAGVPDVAPGLPEVNVGSTASGGGGGAVGPGTIDTVAKFTAANAIGDSSITDDGVIVTIGIDTDVTGDLAVGQALGVTASAVIGVNLNVVVDADVGNDLTVGADATVTGAVAADSLSTVAAAVIGTNLTANNALTTLYQTIIQGYFARQQALSPAALAAGTTNDYDLNPGLNNGRIRQATNAANSALGGMVNNGINGAEWILKNLGPGTLTLLNEAGGSAAANRFELEGGVDRVIGVGGTVIITYDNGSSRWNCIG